jgi:aryl-alcohol dehydrogenase-like predicted oxidoreductase
VVQVPYSALERRHEEMMLAVSEMGIGVIVRGGIAVGHRAYGKIQETWERSGLARLTAGMSRYEFLLRFALAHPACHTTIVGTTNPAHLKSNVSAARRGPLSPDLYARAKQLLDAAGERPEEC